MRSSLLLALLLTSGVAAAQTIELAGPATGMRPRRTERVRVAGTATESLAVWTEGRSLRAARVDLLGRPLDDRSLEIATSDVFEVQVATDGRDYLVAYSTCTGNEADCAGRFATISPDGTVFQSRQRLEGARVESLAWSGERYVLAYHVGSKAPAAASLAILDRRGFVLEDRISPTDEAIHYVDLAGDGAGRVALVWAGFRGSGFASGSLDDLRRGALTPVRLTGVFYPMSVAASPSGFVVSGSDSTYHWRTFLIDRSGVVTSATSSIQAYPEYTVGATSTMRFAVFAEETTTSPYKFSLLMRPVDRVASPRTVAPGLIRSYGVDIASTSDGGAVLGWDQDGHGNVSEVRVVRMTAGGTLLRPPGPMQPVNRGFVDYDTPAVRRCGETFVTAWVERSDRSSVRFRRVSSSGAALDPPSRRATSLTPQSQSQFGPGIACTDGSILITWIETPPLSTSTTSTPTSVARGLLLTGGVERLLEFGPAQDFYAAGIGGEYVVVRESGSEWHEASHWRTDGTQRTQWTQLFHQPTCGNVRSVIESNGQELMIANVNHCPTRGLQYVIARPYSRELMMLRTAVTFEGRFVGFQADVAAGPDGWLVAWGAGETSFGRIRRDFLGLDPRVGISAGLQGPLSAAWNGCTFEIAGRDAVTLVPMDGAATTVAVPPAVLRVASDGAGQRFVVTTERDADGAMRVMGRFEDSPRCVR